MYLHEGGITQPFLTGRCCLTVPVPLLPMGGRKRRSFRGEEYCGTHSQTLLGFASASTHCLKAVPLRP